MNQNSSHIIILNDENKALVVRRSPNDEWGSGKLAIPGGRREPGETLLQNIQRETREEVSLILDANKIFFLPTISKKLNHCFFVTKHFKGEVKLGDKEHSDFGWIHPKQLSEQDSVPNLKLELEAAYNFMNGLTFTFGAK